MTTKENIDILRKPGAQALSLISLFLILFSCLTFFFGLDYESFPNYLKITTIIELIIKSSPDSCVKCYTMFLPFLLIKIDVFS